MTSTDATALDLRLAAEAHAVTKHFGEGPTEVTALDNISVGFEAGRFTAIMGPSGSGKSTLLHCLAGLEAVSSGRVLIGGTDLSTLNDRELTILRRDRIGFVFQAYNLLPTLDAARNIALQARLGGRTPDPAWLDTIVASLGLGERLHHRPRELSGGEQQRVAVARALVNKPEIIFADEPTGNLDSASGHDVLGFLRRAVDDLDQTVVMVTHDANAAAFADRIIMLSDGRVVDDMAHLEVTEILDRLKQLGG